MSEFIAEAQVLVRPNTTGFRAALEAELRAAARGVTVSIPVSPITTGTTDLTRTVSRTAASTRELTAAQILGAEAARKSTAEQAKQTRQLGELEKAAVANTAGFLGLRGAVLTAGTAFLAGTVAIQAFARAVGAAANLESQFNVFRVTVGATAEEMERVREQAKDLGRDLSLPGVTAADAAQTFLALARAGLSVEDSLEGARGTLQLATAAEIEFAEAAQLTASALNAFGLSGESAVDVADTFANAANASQASISDMGIALRQSAAIADLAGFSFSETATFLTQLAQAGLTGSDAGTSFRVAIQRLIAPTASARRELKELEVTLRDAQGNLRPEAFFELADALERQSRAQADATRQLIFGNDASRAAAFFARLNATTFREQERALTRSGTAADVAAARNEGFSGSLENAKNQASALGTELGELAIPALGVTVDVTAEFFGLLADSIARSREGLADFGDDAEKIQILFQDISDESGFTQFARDVASGAQLIAGDITRASNATDEFFAGLLGVEQSAARAVTPIRELSAEEARLAEKITDVHDRVDIQVRDFEDLSTAAERAAAVIARLTGQIAGLEEGVTRARIAGDQGGELDLLRQERERLQRLLAIEEGIVAEGGRGAATARRRIREQILPQLESVNAEINRIIEQQASDAKALADDAQRARDERDRNILDAIGGEEAALRNAEIRAEATEALKDDLAAQIALRNFFNEKLKQVRTTVEDAKAKAQAIRVLTADLIRAEIEIENIEKELQQQRRRRRAEARDRQRESLQLDIEIAQATGNRQAEIRARQAEINFLQRMLRNLSFGRNQRKRLLLELRRAQAELKDLTGQQKSTSKAFAELTFEFLQQQQGFAANLFGNLIPSSATGGLVSPVAAPAQAVRREAAVSEARERGFTIGQGDTTNELLRRILRALENLNGRAGHPEARYQRTTGNSSMDVFPV